MVGALPPNVLTLSKSVVFFPWASLSCLMRNQFASTSCEFFFIGLRCHGRLFDCITEKGDSDSHIVCGGESTLSGVHGFLLSDLMVCVSEEVLKTFQVLSAIDFVTVPLLCLCIRTSLGGHIGPDARIFLQ